ncbi:MAG: hypothetical protein KAI24_06690, partial [Planctomycetes bacterium]|nr:hypothetical protein [Planctomycetota bacterium]
GAWRRDPFGAGEELDYGLVGSDARLRSRGGDGRLGGVDDTTIAVVGETQLRVRQRLRLRMLRAVLLRSQFRWDSAMTPGDVARMRAAMRDLAVAKRQWLGADAATRADLTTRMNAATTTIEGLVSAYGLPPIPSSLTAAGGLMSQLSMPDARAVDGAGAALLRDAVLGFVAAGADRNGGTDDDM